MQKGPFAARAQYARHCLVYWDSDGIQNVVLFFAHKAAKLALLFHMWYNLDIY